MRTLKLSLFLWLTLLSPAFLAAPVGLDAYLALLAQTPAGKEPPIYPETCLCPDFRGEGVPPGLDILWLRNHEDGSWPKEKAFAFIWRDAANLRVCAVMEDCAVGNSAVGRHSDPHQKGDVMELFFQPAGKANYFELHVAPSLATLEMATASVEAFDAWKHGDSSKANFQFDSGMIPEAGTFILPSGLHGWWGRMTIPLAKLGIAPDGLAGAKWLVGRYNYDFAAWGKVPEVSATARKGLHAPDKWCCVE